MEETRKTPPNYGGQAVIEGVMMRGQRAMAVSVRHHAGHIVTHSEPLRGLYYEAAWARRPFLRGVFLLWHSLTLGMRSLVYSVNVGLDGADAARATERSGGATSGEAAARRAFGGGLMWSSLATAMVLAIGIFFVSPAVLAGVLERVFGVPARAGAVLEGIIRILIVLAYLWLIGRLPAIARVFAYHGAEHRVINAFEAGEPLRPDRVAAYSVAHPRCGTAFLLYVVVLSAFVFALLGQPPLPLRIASRIVLVPVVASIAYEVIRLTSRRRAHPFFRLLIMPGLALQSLTTREPDERQVEVAIAALERVIELDGTSRGEQPARRHSIQAAETIPAPVA